MNPSSSFPEPDPYALLGLARDVSEDEVWAVFHARAAALVRGRSGDDYTRLLDALQILTDPQRRAALDRRLAGVEVMSPPVQEAPPPQQPRATRTPTLVLRKGLDEIMEEARIRELAKKLDQEASSDTPSPGRLALRAYLAFRLDDESKGFQLLKAALAADPACAYAHYALAVHVQQRGRSEDAWGILQWALPHVGGDRDLWVRIMDLAASLGWPDGPLPTLIAAMGEFPGDVQMAELLVRRLLAHDRGTDALARVREVVTAVPKDPGGWRLQGWVQAALGDGAAAETSYLRALELEPRHPEALRELSRLYVQATHPAAGSLLARALAVLPDDAGLWGLQGIHALQSGDLGGAERHLSRAQALAPTSAEFAGPLAETLIRLGKATEALEPARRLAATDKASERGPFFVGEALHMLGRFEEAIPSYLQALDRCMDPTPVLYALARCHAELGRPVEALGYLENVAVSDPEVWVLRARLLGASDRQEEAGASWQEVLRQVPDRADALLGLATSLLSGGDETAAWPLIDRYMASWGHDPSALDELAAMWTGLGRHDLAVEAYQRAVGRSPGERARHERLWAAMEQAEQWQALHATLTQAIRLFPEDPELALRLASSYERMNLVSEAVLAYRRYLRLAPRSAEAKSVRARLKALE